MLRLRISLKKFPALGPGMFACVASRMSYPWILSVDNLPYTHEKLMAWLDSEEIYYLEIYE
jgi:hypothetical protein